MRLLGWGCSGTLPRRPQLPVEGEVHNSLYTDDLIIIYVDTPPCQINTFACVYSTPYLTQAGFLFILIDVGGAAQCTGEGRADQVRALAGAAAQLNCRSSVLVSSTLIRLAWAGAPQPRRGWYEGCGRLRCAVTDSPSSVHYTCRRRWLVDII